jgi:hypothetical protein
LYAIFLNGKNETALLSTVICDMEVPFMTGLTVYKGLDIVLSMTPLWITRSPTAIHVNIINVKKTAQIRFHTKKMNDNKNMDSTISRPLYTGVKVRGDIGGIIYHHCLSFLFLIGSFSSNYELHK